VRRRESPAAPAGEQRAGVGHYVRVAPAEVRFVEMCPGGMRECGRPDVLHRYHVPAGQSRYEHLRRRADG
jgi:hypothetical protein